MFPNRFPARGAALCALALLLLLPTTGASAKSAFLGIQMQELNEALIEALDLDEGTRGLLVSDVVEESAAEQAGIQRGDVLLQLDGRELRSVSSFQRRIGSLEAGDEITLQVFRDGKKRDVKVTLGEQQEESSNRFFGWRDEDAPRARRGDRSVFVFEARPQLGLRLEPVEDQLGNYFGVQSGLLVLEVYEDSAAEEAGIQVGDVLTQAGGEALAEVQDLLDILDEREDGDELAIQLTRERKSQEVTATLREPETMELGRRMPGANNFRFFAPRMQDGNRDRMPNMFFRQGDDELREELDRLRDELESLRQELSELRRG